MAQLLRCALPLVMALLAAMPAATQDLPDLGEQRGRAPHAASRRAFTDGCSRQAPPAQRQHLALPTPPAPTTRRPAPAVYAGCSAAQFDLSGSALVNAVATGGSCLDVLWSFDATVASVIQPGNISAIAAAIVSESQQLAANAGRITNLTYFLQIAYFHEFYQSSVTYSGAVNDAAQSAVAGIGTKPAFLSETSALSAVRRQWIVTIDSVNGTHLALTTVEDLIERWIATPALKLEYVERLIAFNAFFTLARQPSNAAIAYGSQSPWLGLVPTSLIQDMQTVGHDLGFDANTQAITENALFAFGNFSVLDAPTASLAHAHLSTAYQIFPQYTGPWFRALTDLDYFFDAELSNGTPLPIEQIKDDVLAFALPHEYTFDQGRLTFRTAVPLTTAESLYDAMQEVESQFFRNAPELAPVPGDFGDELTLVIYGSPAEYALYQPFLYGLSTANGGIYIEAWTTLFTYERTPQESIFTLEELLRHEYVHYLDGRYMIEGGFYGPGTLYENGLIDTYGEGLAEALVGSTRSQGVLRRGVTMSQIDGTSTWMTISEVLNGTYDLGFAFYPFAGALMTFLEHEQSDVFAELLETVRGNDSAALSALYAQLSSDTQLQAAYEAHLTAAIGEWNAGTGLFAEDVPTTPTPTNLPVGNAAAVRSAVQAQAPTATGTFLVWADRYRYSDEWTLAAPGSLGDGAVNALFDGALDTTLVAMESLGPNFASTVAWFGDVERAGGLATASYVIEGPYTPDPADVTPPSSPTGLTGDAGLGSVVLSWTANSDADLAGYHVYRADSASGPFVRLDSSTWIDTTFTDASPAASDKHYRVTAVDATGNESQPSPTVVVGPDFPVLIVNGYFSDGNTSYVGAYSAALNSLGIASATWDPFVDGTITEAVLAPYTNGLVIWAVGYFHPSYPDQLDAAKRAAIKGYLDAGGRLVFSGSYMGGYIKTTELFTDYFHAEWVQTGPNFAALDGLTGSTLGDGLTLTLGNPVSASELDVTFPAQPEFVFDGASGSGTIQSSGVAAFTVDDGYRVAYLAFPFNTLPTTDRVDLLGAITSWMLDDGPWTDLGSALAGTNGEPSLTGAGALVAGELVTLTVDDARADAVAQLVVGAAQLDAPFKGGLLIPTIDAILPLPLDSQGSASLSLNWPMLIPAGTTLYYQAWIDDAAGPKGFAATNGLSSTSP